MNVLILNTQVPFCYGGAEVLAEDLRENLRAQGHGAEIMTLPFKWYPQQTLVNTILVSKLTDVSNFNGLAIDKVIALKFPMWLIPHPDMSFWILHQHRSAYDLWDSNLSDLAAMPDGKSLRDLIRREDDRAFARTESLYTISRNVSKRLKHYNEVDSQVLYPPPRAMEKYTVEGARAKLDQLRRAGQMKETTGRALRADAVEMLRSELENLHQILSADAKA